MYRAHGTRIMAVHANRSALRSPRIRQCSFIPRSTRMSLGPDCGRADSYPWLLHILRPLPYYQLLPPGATRRRVPLHDSTLQHVGQTLQQEGHWQCHRPITADITRLANRRIPSWRKTNMVACSCHSTAGSQHSPDCSATGTSIEETRWWFWTG